MYVIIIILVILYCAQILVGRCDHLFRLSLFAENNKPTASSLEIPYRVGTSMLQYVILLYYNNMVCAYMVVRTYPASIV